MFNNLRAASGLLESFNADDPLKIMKIFLDPSNTSFPLKAHSLSCCASSMKMNTG